MVPAEPATTLFPWLSRLKALATKAYGAGVEAIGRAAGAPERALRLHTRASVPASSTLDITDANVMLGGFSASLRNRSVFFRLFEDPRGIQRAPLRTRLGVIASDPAVGAFIEEGSSIPLTRILIEANTVIPVRRAAAMVAMTDEMVSNVSSSGQSLFAAELLGATAEAVDAGFLALVLETDTGSTIGSSGTTAADSAADLRSALLQIRLHSGSRLFWISSPIVAVKAATLFSEGAFVHPAMGPLGGEMVGVPCLISDAVADDELHLIDASQIMGDLEGVDVRASRAADVSMLTDSSMTSTGPVATEMVSLWQTDSVALLSQVYYGSARLRADSTATISGINWGEPNT